MKNKSKVIIIVLAIVFFGLALITDIGTIENENSILFINGNGYYTEKQLNNIGGSVLVIGDVMVGKTGLTLLK